MKPKVYFPAVFALLASAAGLPALAAVNRTDLLGDPAPSAAAMRTITIDENTKYVNVKGGEVVKFVAGDKAAT
ncbi:MAG: hypothetical protein JWQ21_3289, partial [Herminiimonas sp.]|nr:hypothetical protein [Herminiimonas sp.]